MGAYVLYSSSEGIVAIDGSGARVLTEGLSSPQQWRHEFDFGNYYAARYEGTYLAVASLGNKDKSFVLDTRNNAIKIAHYSHVEQTSDRYWLYHDTATDEVYLRVGPLGVIKEAGGRE